MFWLVLFPYDVHAVVALVVAGALIVKHRQHRRQVDAQATIDRLEELIAHDRGRRVWSGVERRHPKTWG